MICWDRCGESGYVGVLSRSEIDVLQSYVIGLLTLVEHRTASHTVIAVVAGREVRVPAAVTEDPRILAILENELGEDEPDWVLAVGEEQCLLSARGSLQLMSSTLPETGGVVRLRSRDEAGAWLRSIRFFLSTIAVVADSEGRVKGKDVAPTVTWLCEVSGTLRSAVARTVIAARPAC